MSDLDGARVRYQKKNWVAFDPPWWRIDRWFFFAWLVIARHRLARVPFWHLEMKTRRLTRSLVISEPTVAKRVVRAYEDA